MKKNISVITLLLVALITSCKKDNPPAPVIDFIYSNNICTPPDTVQFHATVENVNSVQWYFGDGGSGTGLDVSHVYTHAGYYAVQAIATGEGGTISRFKNVNVSPYTVLRITRTSTTVPLLNPGGSPWDTEPNPANNNPDLRVILYNSSGAEIMNDHFVAADVFSAAFNYPSPVAVTDFEGSFTVKVYDYDTPSFDDFIGLLSFRPADYMNDTTAAFPLNFSKSNNQGLSVGVLVTWGN